MPIRRRDEQNAVRQSPYCLPCTPRLRPTARMMGMITQRTTPKFGSGTIVAVSLAVKLRSSLDALAICSPDVVHTLDSHPSDVVCRSSKQRQDARQDGTGASCCSRSQPPTKMRCANQLEFVDLWIPDSLTATRYTSCFFAGFFATTVVAPR